MSAVTEETALRLAAAIERIIPTLERQTTLLETLTTVTWPDMATAIGTSPAPRRQRQQPPDDSLPFDDEPPRRVPANPPRSSTPRQASAGAPVCPDHQQAMRKRTSNSTGKTFWGCSVKITQATGGRPNANGYCVWMAFPEGEDDVRFWDGTRSEDR